MAVFINKIVTRGGDGGETSLGNGERVSKASKRIKLLGSLDEANAYIGVLMTIIASDDPHKTWILRIQTLLFDLGALLSIPEKAADSPNSIKEQALAILSEIEAHIEALRAHQSALESFILPGGSPASAYAHVVRTLIRRTERHIVELAEQEKNIDSTLIAIINRLSDYFFVLARHYNEDGKADILWKKQYKNDQ